ncbi:type II and III secretion system protein [Novosphingobium aromaticivorans DSM 12444]|uniref:Type II and III secretion system protein n=1 Tax=Novosphingobium aromaticivorans (strain ATCC 700278 / DSM 12444 / CCUG 56034 / CIP 105152 / NBRC 16084 / F199) TaxID=279238 RepID=Q2G9E9_NOVAD|nr:type II and III secretion system protein family protein [Novosphingobium aromaticivorans]ABD25524.1 type II and III secretion system protein [Novosphingobium aromaticivorans DSM 12444]SCX96324.1 pilus assembly protein CpaC [Novosphingobium aromaticivorans]
MKPARQNQIAKVRTMNRRISTSLLTAAALALPLALVPAGAPLHAQGMTSPARTVTISIGRGELVTVPGRMADVFVADERVADVQVKSTNQLYVFGKAGGETTIYASNAKGDVVWSANVRVGNNLDSIDQMLHLAMPEARINVATMNNTVLLTGTVAAPEDAAEAERLVKAFVGEKTNVISRLKMATPLQVSLHVKFAEVSRSLVRTLGVNLTTIDGTGGIKFGIGQGSTTGSVATNRNLPFGVGTSSTSGYILDPTGATSNYVSATGTSVAASSSGTTIAGMGKLLGLDLLAALDAGETIGLVTTLSEPNLTAISGETAEFLAGGEYPIPVSQGLGTTSIEYKKYGVSLAYTPTVLANGRISIRVRPEASELSSTGALKLDSVEIPALTVRRAETTVELGSGQSFMIAGLLQNGAQNALTKMPGAGDIPILGSLFRSTSYKKGETELVIVVTPYLVNPVNANDIKLPTDGFQSPNEIQRLLGHMESDGVTGGDRPKPTQKEGTTQQGPKVGELDVPTTPADRKKVAAAPAAAEPGFSIQ